MCDHLRYEPARLMSWLDYLLVEMKRLDRHREVAAIQVLGSGHGVVNGLLCNSAMERLESRYSVELLRKNRYIELPIEHMKVHQRSRYESS